jgi:hypothetical protein
VETCTAGAAGGPGKPSGSNPGRAPRPDPTHQRVVAAVWDGSNHRPARAAPDDPEADHGRGLLLVETLSEEWGVHTPERSSGKVVWAVMTA